MTTGFARNAVLGVAGDVVKAVQDGHLKHIFLIGGCDGSGALLPARLLRAAAPCPAVRACAAAGAGPSLCRTPPTSPPCRAGAQVLWQGGGRHAAGHHAAHAGLRQVPLLRPVSAGWAGWNEMGGLGWRCAVGSSVLWVGAREGECSLPHWPACAPASRATAGTHARPLSPALAPRSDYGMLPNTGLPRLIDMGQCNDAYSAVVVASKLAEVRLLALLPRLLPCCPACLRLGKLCLLGQGRCLQRRSVPAGMPGGSPARPHPPQPPTGSHRQVFKTDVNGLPLSLDLSWLEQKAVAVLLTLLHLGVKVRSRGGDGVQAGGAGGRGGRRAGAASSRLTRRSHLT